MRDAIVRDKKLEDPDLARAGIVLVPDGAVPVDGELMRAAREQAGDVALTVSVIALGDEDPFGASSPLAREGRGERAIYHDLDGCPVPLGRAHERFVSSALRARMACNVEARQETLRRARFAAKEWLSCIPPNQPSLL